MSSGQRPRTHVFFPKMKRRSWKREFGKVRVTLYGHDLKPVWPQVMTLGGRTYQMAELTLVVNGRTPGPDGYWEDRELSKAREAFDELRRYEDELGINY